MGPRRSRADVDADQNGAVSDTTTAAATEMCSYAVDLWTADADVLTNVERLSAILREASEAGNATVLAEASHVFPNGAVTVSLVLSQSHLSVHTWPEYQLANVDLLTCGVLEGDTILNLVQRRMGATRANVTRVTREASSAPH